MMRETNPWQKHYHSDPDSLSRGEVTVSRRGSRILLAGPYLERFRVGAHRIMGAQWRRAIKVWSFPVSESREVRDLIETVYGTSYVPEWMKEGKQK